MSHDSELSASGGLYTLIRRKDVLVLTCAPVLMAFLVPNSMLSQGGLADDNSVFAYIGWLMHRDYMPYRDIWDHKGPVLYALNWAGWIITPGTTIGIGLLQVLAYALAFFLLALVLKKFASPWVMALLSLFSLSFVAGYNSGGNMTESWGLVPSAIAIYLAFEVPSGRLGWHHSVLAATAVSMAFWTRPDLSLIPLTAWATMVAALARRDTLNQTLTFIIIGVGTIVLETGLILLPFWRVAALSKLSGEYFVYNRNYAETVSLGERISGAAVLISGLLRKPLFIVGVIGWGILAWNAGHRRWDSRLPGGAELMVLVLLPLVLTSCLMTGRPYGYYLLTLWPVLTITGARVVEEMIRFLGRVFAGPSGAKKTVVALAGVLLLVEQVGKIAQMELVELRGGGEPAAVARYIDAITTPVDRVVPVGSVRSVQIALYARRLPATSYIYQLPLVHRANPLEYTERTLFLKKISAERPAVIFSMPSPVGSLCRSAVLDADQTHGATAYGYSIGAIPRDLGPILTRNYSLVNGFNSACVYVRRPQFADSVATVGTRPRSQIIPRR